MVNLRGLRLKSLRNLWTQIAPRSTGIETGVAILRRTAGGLPNVSAMLLDLEGSVLAIEGECLKNLGFPSETLLKQPLSQTLPTELAAPLKQGVVQAASGQALTEQIQFNAAILLMHSVPLYAESGQNTTIMIVLHNISAFLAADIALRETDARYRLIAENSYDIITVHLPDGRMVYISPSVYQVLGYTPEELIHTRPKGLIDYTMLQRMVEEHTRESREISVAEHRVQRKDGSEIWMESLFRIVHDPLTGAPQHIISSSRDVTERTETQVALQRSEEQLRSLISSIDDLIFSLDLNGRFLVYHQMQNSIHDTPLFDDTYIGKHYRDVLPPELGEQLDSVIPSVMSTLQTHALEYSLQYGQRTRYFSARLSPMISPHIELLGITCVAREVTNTVLANQRQEKLLHIEMLHRETTAMFLENDDTDVAIRQSLERVGGFLNASHTFLIQLRENERIADLTHEWHAPDQASMRGQLQNIRVDDVLPSFIPILSESEAIAAKSVTDLPDELYRLVEPFGIQSLLLLPFTVNNQLEGVVGVSDNQTTRDWLPEEISAIRSIAQSIARAIERNRAAYELIRTRDSAIHSAKMKSDFMSNMSHEIRTPMTGVIGMLELLRETPLNDDQSEFVNIAHISAQRLMHLLDDILDFSKIESGKVTLENIPIDIRGLISEIQGNFAAQAAKKQIDLQHEVAPSVPERVLGDPTRLRQVLANLLSNAIKFTPAGSIRITVQDVAIAQGRVRLRFEVQDTGIGIPENQLETIFNSFVQADSSMTRRYGGTGLGLAICQQLVALMGGQIDVKSTVGKGSAFGFTLTMTTVTLSERYVAATPLSNIQALVIGDEKPARFALAQQLRRWGLSIIETSDLQAAARFLRNAANRAEEFELVFLETFGEETSRWMEAISSELQHLAPRFILITANAATNVGEKFDTVLNPPLRLSQLYNVIVKSSPWAEGSLPPEGDGFITVPQHGRILLAEDDAMNWKIVVRALSQMGYVVDVARDGAEAVALVQENNYHMVLMDVHMPNMDGMEATRHIRTLPPPKGSVPIVALTASVLESEQQIYLEAGMSGFLAKPFALETLRATVQTWTSRTLPHS